jgi:hypothetical protein
MTPTGDHFKTGIVPDPELGGLHRAIADQDN